MLCARGRCVLVLDGVEHLCSELGPAVARWRSVAPEATLLVTSREPLRIAGERRSVLGPMSEADALALLTDRAKLVMHEEK